MQRWLAAIRRTFTPRHKNAWTLVWRRHSHDDVTWCWSTSEGMLVQCSLTDCRVYWRMYRILSADWQVFYRLWLQSQTSRRPSSPQTNWKTVLDRGARWSRSDRPRYRATTPTRAGLHRCCCPRPDHATRLATLPCSWRRDNKNVLLKRPLVTTQP